MFNKALSSQLEAILDNEQRQMDSENTNDLSGGGRGGGNFWNFDENYEDYYNEGR